MNDRVSISKSRVLAPNEHIVIMRYQVCYRTHNTKLEIAAFAEKKKATKCDPQYQGLSFLKNDVFFLINLCLMEFFVFQECRSILANLLCVYTA